MTAGAQRGLGYGHLLVLLAIAACAAVIWRQDHTIAQLKLQQADAAKADQQALAEYWRALGEFNTQTIKALAVNEEESNAKLEELRRIAAAERAGRLRADATLAARTRELQGLARRAATDAEREASAAAIGVFADVLGRIDDKAGILAAAADDSRARGNACQRQYETVAARINAGMPEN